MNEPASVNGSLAGKRIVVTRAQHQAPRLEKLIRQFGGIPVTYPCIAFKAPTDPRPLDEQLCRLGDFDWLLLTSSNTVRALAHRLRALDIEFDGARIKVAAVGDATRAEIQRLLSADADFTPTRFSGSALAKQLPLHRSARILLPQSDRADKALALTLRERGAAVTTCIAYQTVIGRGGPDLSAMFARQEIAALTFASPSAVEFFRLRCPSRVALTLPTACIGPWTAAAASRKGFAHVIHPLTPTLHAMLLALADHLSD